MERGNKMRKLVVSEWITLDGVFDADTMKEWFEPYDSDGRRIPLEKPSWRPMLFWLDG